MRLLLATLTAIVVLLAAAPAVMASYTGTVNAAGTIVTLNGNGAGDSLVVTDNGLGQLEHSNIGAGFVSAADWDTVAGGVQTVSSTDPDVRVTLEAGDGDDSITIGSPAVAPFDIKARFVWDGEGGANFARFNGMGELERTYVTRADGAEVEGGARILTDATMTTGLIIVGGNRADTFRVLGTPGLTVTFLDALAGDDNFVFPNGLSEVGGNVITRGGEGTDSLLVDDSAGTNARHYSIAGGVVQRGNAANLEFDDTTDVFTLRTGSGDDRVSKSGDRAVSIDTGPGFDQVVTRDAVSDQVACGTESDFVLSDPLDGLASDCESSDRTPTGGAGPVAPGAAADRTAPKLTLSGLPKKAVTVKQLLKGLRVKVASDEPVALEAAALGSSSRVSLSRAYNVTLASARAPLAAGARTVRLKPAKRLIGRARKFSVRVSVSGTDASGNRTTRSVIVKVRR